MSAVWDGAWVSGQLGIWYGDGAFAGGEDCSAFAGGKRSGALAEGGGDGAFTGSEGGGAFAALAGLAVRRNPNRAHLVVSRVLGKHIPVDPRTAVQAGRTLGAMVAEVVNGPVTVLGHAETATALGHLVADCLNGARYLHSTRRIVPGVTPLGGFDEIHSHARRHLLLPADQNWFVDEAPVVIVDDELTTGKTVIASIRQIEAIHRRARYVVATLLDLRSGADRSAMADAASDLGVTISVVALATGHLTVPHDILDRGRRIVETMDMPDPVALARPAPMKRIDPPWPDDLPHSGRHGFVPANRGRFAQALDVVAGLAAGHLPARGSVLVLGTEELMYAPMMMANRLRGRHRGPVRFSSTTRSPVLPIGVDGYAVRTRLTFDAHDAHDSDVTCRFAYNVVPMRSEKPYESVIVVVDHAGDTPRLWGETGLVERLRRTCRAVSVVVLPAERLTRTGGAR